MQFGNACTAFQNVVGFYCGCPGANETGVCRICGNGNPLPKAAREVNISAMGGKATCSQLELDASIHPDKCPLYQAHFASPCCSTAAPVVIHPYSVAPVRPPYPAPYAKGKDGKKGKEGKKGKKGKEGKKGKKDKNGKEGKKGKEATKDQKATKGKKDTKAHEDYVRWV